MITISNSDRDATVRFLRDLAAIIARNKGVTIRQANTRRMALLLAAKLERKEPK